MTKAEAHAILDAAKAGQPVPERDITAALFWTGDLRTYRKPDEQAVDNCDVLREAA